MSDNNVFYTIEFMTICKVFVGYSVFIIYAFGDFIKLSERVIFAYPNIPPGKVAIRRIGERLCNIVNYLIVIFRLNIRKVIIAKQLVIYVVRFTVIVFKIC